MGFSDTTYNLGEVMTGRHKEHEYQTRAVECSGDWAVPVPMLEPICAGWEGVCVIMLWCVSGGLIIMGVVAGVEGTAA